MRPSAMRPGSPRYRALSRGSRSRAPRVPKLELPLAAPLSSGESGPAGRPVVSAVCRMRCPLRAVDGGDDDPGVRPMEPQLTFLGKGEGACVRAGRAVAVGLWRIIIHDEAPRLGAHPALAT